MKLHFTKKITEVKTLKQIEDMDGSDGTREDTEDTTMLVQIEEVKRGIRTLPFVTKLSPVRAHNGHGAGWGVSLRYFP